MFCQDSDKRAFLRVKRTPYNRSRPYPLYNRIDGIGRRHVFIILIKIVLYLSYICFPTFQKSRRRLIYTVTGFPVL